MNANLNFGTALQALKDGRKASRQNWNGKGMWILLHPADDAGGLTHPFLCIEYPTGHPAYPHGSRIPWLPSQTDLLSEDWAIVE